MPKEKCDRDGIKVRIHREFKISAYTKTLTEFKSFEMSMIKKFAVLDNALGLKLLRKSQSGIFSLAETISNKLDGELDQGLQKILAHDSLNKLYGQYNDKYRLLQSTDPRVTRGIGLNSSFNDALKSMENINIKKQLKMNPLPHDILNMFYLLLLYFCLINQMRFCESNIGE